MYKFAYILLLLVISCTNPFATRSPEEPENTDNAIYDQAIDPEITITNFSRAIEQKNLFQYMQCFVPTDQQEIHQFTYRPEPFYENDFVNRWTLDDERNFFVQLTGSGNQNYPRMRFSFLDTLSLRPINPTAVDDSVETQSMNYELEIDFSADSSTTFRGTSIFRLFRSNQAPELWHIYYWQDNAINENFQSTWTFLKLYVNQ
ncbi:MAG: hypothetical protein GF313_08905 [Caldithrix sp.]|nr:hypothetical protein [Caldithrix sp.]